jgi:FMN-dependent NADH-azoreductase
MEADEYVIGVPMWNFGVPAMLKAYIDQIARVGVTFAYVDGVPQGKVTGKKATFLIASGGKYDAGTATAGLNFVEPYLQAVFGFLGLKDVTFHTAGGASALNYGADRAEFLAPHDTAVSKLVK